MLLKFSYDDGTVEDLKIADLMVKYGFVDNTTFYWCVLPRLVNEPKGRTSLSDMRMQEIAKTFSVGSHTISHPKLTRIPLDQARNEIFTSRKVLQEKFSQDIRSLCWPRGYTNPDLMKLAQEAGYENARGVTVGYIHKNENPYDEKTTIHAGMDRKEYAGLPWYSYALNMINEARNTPGSIVHIWSHGWELAKYPRGFQLFEELLKELS